MLSNPSKYLLILLLLTIPIIYVVWPKLEHVRDELYTDNSGNLYFKAWEYSTSEEKKYTFLRHVYLVSDHKSELKPLAKVLDNATFHGIGGTYYKDENYIYYYFVMDKGGTLSTVYQPDINSFEVLASSWYAIDQLKVYFRGITIDGADPSTFELIAHPDVEWYAKDSQYYYDQGEIMPAYKAQALMEKL